MTTLRDGTVIDESLTAKGFTAAANVPNRTYEAIFIHHWGALGQTHDGVNNFFVNGPGQTSPHYVASDGRVNCLVSDPDVAWHSGVWDWNIKSLGIECRPEATDGDYITVAALIYFLRQIHGDLPLKPHRSVYSTDCPGIWDLDRLDSLAQNNTQEDDLDTEAKAWIKETHDRVLGRDVQRWFNPNTLEVRTEPFAGGIPARTTDVHDVISSNNLLVAQTDKILDAVSKIPGVDPSIIAGLRQELSDELKAATANLTVVLKTTP
jgi:hypothetical protein